MMWPITKARLCKLKSMNMTADSADELRRPFRWCKLQVITVNAETAIKRLSGLGA
jgi:hypothetical protein